ncbi:4-hydroxy-tetrahydrodipicolinate synthase [bacterium]|nr:4-hydroxy-tetrahydrodipicolinate synthase [bacterium]
MNGNFGEVITAMVTPFKKDLSVDFEALEKLTNHLINNGSDAILVAGTTGECPTLTHEEEREVFKCVQNTAKGTNVKVILGAGSNSTKTAVNSAIEAEKLNADAILTVVPYYNKPSQRGMITHFSAIANAVDLPIIIYNIPGRTGVNMQPQTVAQLSADHKNIVALKQSNSDLDLISDIKSLCSDDFVIYSGDDSLTLPMLSLGVEGVISVASHVIGNEIKEMISAFKQGNNKKALDLHLKMYPLFRKIFFAPNPTPIKQILSELNIMNNCLREPLVELTESEKAELRAVYEATVNSLRKMAV